MQFHGRYLSSKVGYFETVRNMREILLGTYVSCVKRFSIRGCRKFSASKNEFSLLKKEAILINTSRGGIVDEKALYNSNTSTDFTLHESEEDTLIVKVLELAGIIMNKPGLVQIAANKDAAEVAMQKV